MDNSKAENLTPEEINKNKYRFNGERYSFKGVDHFADPNIVPQLTGFFAFPKDDMQNFGDSSNSTSQIPTDYIGPNNFINIL
jgi:hypothetical protein